MPGQTGDTDVQKAAQKQPEKEGSKREEKGGEH
jgi:hypothetical protein